MIICKYMGLKHSEARKKDWAKLTQKERSKRASKTAVARWNKVSLEEKSSFCRMMAIKRWENIKCLD